MSNGNRVVLHLSAIDMMSKVVSSAVASSTASLNSFQQNARRIGREARSSMFDTGAAAVGGAATLGYPLKQAADLERLRKSMEIYTRSAEKGRAVYEDIVNLANQTPLGLEEVARSVTVAMGSGLSAAKAMKATKMLGDITAANPMADMGQAMVAYTQAAQGGKLMTRDIWQLINAGVPIVDILRNHLGATAKIMGKGGMAEEGKITFEVLQQAMEKATGAGGMFENGLVKLAGTAHGRFSIVKDAVNQSAAALGESLLPTMMALSEVILPILNGLSALIREFPKVSKWVMIGVGVFTIFAGIAFVVNGALWATAFIMGTPLLSSLVMVIFRFSGLSFVVGIATKAFHILKFAIWTSNFSLLNLAKHGIANAMIGLRGIARTIMAQVIPSLLRLAIAIYNIPILGWIIAVVAGIIAIGVAIYKNWDSIVKFFTMLGDKFSAFIPKAKKWGSEMIRSIVDGIKSGAPALFSAIDGVVAFARGFFPASPAKHGAFKDLHKVKIIEQVAQSIKPNSLVRSISDATTVGANSLNRSLTPVASGGGGSVSVNYSPVITIGSGATVGDKASFMEVLENHKTEMMRMISEAGRSQNRKAYA